MDTPEVITLLNDLISQCRHAESGYRRAAFLLDNPQLNMLFRAYALQHAELRLELRSRVRALGGQPDALQPDEDHWRNVVSTQEPMLLTRCAQMAEAIVQVYEAALRQIPPAAIQIMIGRQLAGLRETADHIQALRRLGYANVA